MQSSEAPLCVLIAEDGTSDRLLLSSIVRRQGHEVLTASNGAEAVELFIHCLLYTSPSPRDS